MKIAGEVYRIFAKNSALKKAAYNLRPYGHPWSRGEDHHGFFDGKINPAKTKEEENQAPPTPASHEAFVCWPTLAVMRTRHSKPMRRSTWKRAVLGYCFRRVALSANVAEGARVECVFCTPSKQPQICSACYLLISPCILCLQILKVKCHLDHKRHGEKRFFGADGIPFLYPAIVIVIPDLRR